MSSIFFSFESRRRRRLEKKLTSKNSTSSFSTLQNPQRPLPRRRHRPLQGPARHPFSGRRRLDRGPGRAPLGPRHPAHRSPEGAQEGLWCDSRSHGNPRPEAPSPAIPLQERQAVLREDDRGAQREAAQGAVEQGRVCEARRGSGDGGGGGHAVKILRWKIKKLFVMGSLRHLVLHKFTGSSRMKSRLQFVV